MKLLKKNFKTFLERRKEFKLSVINIRTSSRSPKQKLQQRCFDGNINLNIPFKFINNVQLYLDNHTQVLELIDKDGEYIKYKYNELLRAGLHINISVFEYINTLVCENNKHFFKNEELSPDGSIYNISVLIRFLKSLKNDILKPKTHCFYKDNETITIINTSIEKYITEKHFFGRVFEFNFITGDFTFIGDFSSEKNKIVALNR